MEKEQQIKDFIDELSRCADNWTDGDIFSGYNWDCILTTAMFNMSLDIQYDMDMIESYYSQNTKNIIFLIKNRQLV